MSHTPPTSPVRHATFSEDVVSSPHHARGRSAAGSRFNSVSSAHRPDLEHSVGSPSRPPHTRRSSRVESLRSFVTVHADVSQLGHGPPQPSPLGEAAAPLEPVPVLHHLRGRSSSFSLRPSADPIPESKRGYAGNGTPDDPYVVAFLGDDPDNPRGWRTSYRWFLMVCAMLEMTSGTLGISTWSSGTGKISAEFGVDREIVVVGTSLYLFALAISSLITAPLGEMFGRRPVMIVSFFFFLVFNTAISFSPNIGAYLVLRFICGIFGSASMSHGPAMANDLFNEKEISMPLTLAGIGRFGGPVLGPLIGGFIDQYLGWRWLGHIQAIFTGFIFLVALFIVPETYAPAILRKRATRLAKEINAHHITSYEAGRVLTTSWSAEAKKYLVRPFLLLVCEPIVLLLSLHVSFLYGVLNLYFSAYPFIFSTERGWTQGLAGLPFVACLVGFVVSVPLVKAFDIPYQRAAARSPTGKAAPEQRLWFGILGAGLLPISLFWLGWTANPSIHWMAPTVSGVLFGIGQLGLTLSVFGYFSDTYTYQMGSVLAGSNFMRFALGGVFPLFSQQMFLKLGAGWALSVLGFLCVLFFPAPILFYVYGERIRAYSKYVPKPPVTDDSDEKHLELGGSATASNDGSSDAAERGRASPITIEPKPSL